MIKSPAFPIKLFQVFLVKLLMSTNIASCLTVPDSHRTLGTFTSRLLSKSPKRISFQRKNDVFPLQMIDANTDNGSEEDGGIDVSEDSRLYRILLPRAPGVEWGTDLSFSFVYVRGMDPSGPASLSNKVSIGDQICELRPLSSSGEKEYAPVPLIGTSFDVVMNTFASLKKSVKDVEIVFFKGTKEELKDLCEGGKSSNEVDDRVRITVVQNKGTQDEEIKVFVVDKGSNIRQTLVDEGINVYQSLTRWTNCKGKQLCGTCIVNVKEGGYNTNRKSMDEASTLRENPESYRLSCVTFAYGDVTVETFPPIKVAQWTR